MSDWNNHRKAAGRFVAALVLIGAASTVVRANELSNSGFEETAADKLAAWNPLGAKHAIDRETIHAGRQSLRLEPTDPTRTCGVAQIVRYEKPDKRPIIVGGWSKAHDVGASGDYCLYLDVIYDDGSPWWGKTAIWARGTHDWQYTAQVYRPLKPVREIRAYVFLRRTTGKAWFDDVFLDRGGLHATSVHVAPDFPRTRHGQRIDAQLTVAADWRCALLGCDLQELDSVKGQGKDIVWNWEGQSHAVPALLRITAQTKSGQRLDLPIPLAQPKETSPNPVRDGYAIWWRNGMQKLYPTEFPPPGDLPEVTVSLARNEREGFQLAVTPADDVQLRGVRVSFEPLVDGQGQQFPVSGIEQYLVGYVCVKTPSGHPDSPNSPNWCPEVLLPQRPFDVPFGRTQTVWVNFHATEATPPGTYRGRVVVQPEGLTPRSLPVSVRVRRITLPRVPAMKTAFAIMDGFTRHAYGELTPPLRRQCIDLMLDHRLNPDDISRTDPPAVADLLYARDHGMNTFNILNLVPKPKGQPLWTCYAPLDAYGPDFNKELAARVDGYVQELRRQGLAKLAYFYGFDERKAEYDQQIKEICKFLKERYPEIATFTTAGYMYEKRRLTPPDYQDYMDWYCPLTPRYDRQLSAQLRSQGKQVWWYVCCGPRYPYANFASVDYPSIEGRLLAWMTFAWEADGLLYWHVNCWKSPTVIDDNNPYLNWEPGYIGGMTGDGCLTYPLKSGPASSIRLENIRDGSEDYDYLWLLAQAKGRDAVEACTSRLIKTLTDFNRDPAALEKVRGQIADQLEAIAQPLP
jgi:hypothetical protein